MRTKVCIPPPFSGGKLGQDRRGGVLESRTIRVSEGHPSTAGRKKESLCPDKPRCYIPDATASQ